MTSEEQVRKAPRKRGDRLIRERVHDPYRARRKLPEGTVCRRCSAVVHKGHWVWPRYPETGRETLCPACRRIEDRLPAASLRISGPFSLEHREEIESLIRNLEKREKEQHPLKRIMSIERDEEGLLALYTDPHLARATGEHLASAYEGELEFSYADEDSSLRLKWTR